MSAQFVIPRRALTLTGVLVVAAGLAVWLYLYLPKAVVTVRPATSEREATQTITLSADTTEPDFQRFVLPARVIEETVTEERTVNRQGGNTTPDFAKGVVTLHNDQDEEQPLLPQTHLIHEASGVAFLTDQAVRLPVRGTLAVPVTAKEQGSAGNVPPGHFIVEKLPASLQEVVYGESSAAFSGGEVFDTPVSPDELTVAKEEAKAAAHDRVGAALSSSAGGAPIRDDLTKTTVEEEFVSVEEGSRATSFVVRVRVKAQAFLVDENDLLSLTLLKLRSTPSADEEFLNYEPESFTASFEQADFERGQARVTGSLTGSFARKTQSTIFDTSKLAGRTAAEVQEYFQQFESVGNVAVTFYPFWVYTIPSRPDATEVIVEQ